MIKMRTKKAYKVVRDLKNLYQIIDMLSDSDIMSDPDKYSNDILNSFGLKSYKDIEILRKKVVKGLYEFKNAKDLIARYFDVDRKDSIRSALKHIHIMTPLIPTELGIDLLCPAVREEKIIKETNYFFSHIDLVEEDSLVVLKYSGNKEFHFEVSYPDPDDNIIQVIVYYTESSCWKKFSMHLEYDPETLDKYIIRFWVGEDKCPILW